MAKIFVTGSADGLGQLAAQALIAQGHEVVLHARNAERAETAMRKALGAAAVLTADLSSAGETQKLAAAVNALGHFDAVVHNAGVYQVAAPTLFSVNTLAPYLLTCLIGKPKRLIYLSSGMHLSGSAKLDAVKDQVSRISYADTKLQVLMLCKAFARIWPDVYANAVDPGWVPTKMGGAGAPDDLQKGYETQAWLATSDDPEVRVSGRYFFHQKEARYNPAADDQTQQLKLLEVCREITGVTFPG